LEEEKSVVDDVPFVSAQTMPEFPGGIEALRAFLAKNIDFPETASERKIEGTVYVYFVVEKDGSVSNVKTLRGVGAGCDEEAERVIRKLPKWKPGEQQGKRVRVSFTIPVIFDLK
jgi:periplasmic protein TonB